MSPVPTLEPAGQRPTVPEGRERGHDKVVPHRGRPSANDITPALPSHGVMTAPRTAGRGNAGPSLLLLRNIALASNRFFLGVGD